MKWPQILHGSKQRNRALLFWHSPGVLWGTVTAGGTPRNTAGIPLPGIYPQDEKTTKRSTQAHSRNSRNRRKASGCTLHPGFSRDRRTAVGRAGAARVGRRLDASAAVRQPRSSMQRGWAVATARQPAHSADPPVGYPETCKG